MTWKDHVWGLLPRFLQQFFYKMICTHNALSAIWTKQNVVFTVTPVAGHARVHMGIVIESKGRAYVTTPIFDITMNKEQLYILAGSVEKTVGWLR